MKSKKPFSTVSYNTPEFLHYKLEELYRKRIIDFWAYIKHYPEEDEKKSHLHVYLIPNGQQDTDQLRTELEELDPTDPQKRPLGCLPFTSSKYDDWKLYCDHNEQYLLSKGQKRKYHYVDMDYITSDETYFQELNHKIDKSKFSRNQLIIKAIDDNISFDSLLRTGQIPVQLISQYKTMYDILYQSKMMSTYRGIDRETGELKESHISNKDDDLPF